MLSRNKASRHASRNTSNTTLCCGTYRGGPDAGSAVQCARHRAANAWEHASKSLLAERVVRPSQANERTDTTTRLRPSCVIFAAIVAASPPSEEETDRHAPNGFTFANEKQKGLSPERPHSVDDVLASAVPQRPCSGLYPRLRGRKLLVAVLAPFVVPPSAENAIVAGWVNKR